LCAENAPLVLEGIDIPEPVMFMAIEPKSRADKEKLAQTLELLAAEDPTCQVRRDPETGQMVLSGMGELHLEILKDRMLRDYKVEAATGRPMVAYNETVTAKGEGENIFDREIAGKRQYARIAVEIEPLERGSGVKTGFNVSGEKVPAHFRKEIEEGLNDAIITGVLARYPLTDLQVTVIDGGFDPESSTETAFRSAAVMSFREAVQNATPELLEPLMSLEIVTPAEHMGDVLGDINSRRGKVKEMVARGENQILRAKVPLAELFGYATAVRSLTKGRASYTMEPEEFAIVPPAIRKELLNR
jgi:elongation factor G